VKPHSGLRRLRWRWNDAIGHIIPPVLTLVFGVMVWYALIWLFQFREYILPAPHVVLRTIYEKRQTLLAHSFHTLFEAVAGFLAAIAFGIPCAMAIVGSRALDRSITPILVFSQTFPKAAIAPLLVIWFGFGYIPKIVVAFLVAYFPVVIALVVGMRAAENELVELVQSMKASTLQMFFKVRMPCSLPFFFSGLKTAAAFALVGAVVGEWVGADKGLGFLLVIANADLNTRLTFAVLILLMLYGFLWFSLVALVERMCIPWHVSVRKEELGVTL
jgi:NitT/TauT family transport system permease protein